MTREGLSSAWHPYPVPTLELQLHQVITPRPVPALELQLHQGLCVGLELHASLGNHLSRYGGGYHIYRDFALHIFDLLCFVLICVILCYFVLLFSIIVSICALLTFLVRPESPR